MKSFPLTATGLVKTGYGKIAGIIVNSHTSGTLKLWDNTTNATTVLMDTYTFPAGSSVVEFPEVLDYTVGLYATVGGTVNLALIID